MNDECEGCGIYKLYGGYCDTCAWIARAKLQRDALSFVADVASLECLDTIISALDAVNARVARLELR
ncbi:hypothetical protein [Nocardia niwae]|uniref:hypothetical protein n=1 Tax=Nocardia niwae TaxID=626084 RepID=UPI0007A4F950|nr:hypothetical protein [Nocardia niwae]